MTLPALVGRYQEKVAIARLKKAYSALSQVYLSVTNDYGYPDEWDVMQPEEGDNIPPMTFTYYNILKNYIKKLRICSATNCRPLYKMLNGAQDGNSGYRVASFPMILADGTYIRLNNDDKNGAFSCDTNRGDTKALQSLCSEVFVDINGSQKPNTFGRDVFIFYWTKAGLVPAGTPEDKSHLSFKSTCSNSSAADYSGYGCAAWVLSNENMDYLHCDNLTWDGKHSCK